MKIVFTGGHHSSALPIISKLREVYPEIDIYWFGHKYTLFGSNSVSLEYIEITKLNIPFYNLQAGKLYKTYNLKRLLKVPFGVLHALYLLIKIKPNVVMSFGGYLAAPSVLAAWLLKIPSITHEQTLVAGYSNKFISRFVDKVFLSWPDSQKHYPEKKSIITGLPLRPEIFTSNSFDFLSNNSLPTIYITAGKTGSHKINLVVNESLERLLKICNVIHQCGDHSEYKDYAMLAKTYEGIQNKKLSTGKYFLHKFIYADNIGEAFNVSNLIVTRSGAHICAEIIALKKRALLVPIPWVSHNEQFVNATLLKKIGLGNIVEEKALTPDRLVLEIKDLLEAKTQLDICMYEKYASTLNKDSTQIILNELKSYLK